MVAQSFLLLALYGFDFGFFGLIVHGLFCFPYLNIVSDFKKIFFLNLRIELNIIPYPAYAISLNFRHTHSWIPCTSKQVFYFCTESSYPGCGLSSRCLSVLPPDTTVSAHECSFASEHPRLSESAHAIMRTWQRLLPRRSQLAAPKRPTFHLWKFCPASHGCFLFYCKDSKLLLLVCLWSLHRHVGSTGCTFSLEPPVQVSVCVMVINIL